MDFDRRLAASRDRWSLEVRDRLAGGFRSEVHAATRSDGEPVVLKLSATRAEWDYETAALALWDGAAAVRLIDADPTTGALLVEWLHPGSAMPRGTATPLGTVGELVGALHLPPPRHLRFPTIAGSFPGHRRWALEDLEYERRTRAEPDRARTGEAALPAAGSLLERLAATTDRPVLLHGDFRTKNLLCSGEEFRAVDPMPVLGDPCADLGALAADLPAPMMLDVAVDLARALSLPQERAIGWTVVWAVLQAVQAWRDDQSELDALLQTEPVRRVLDAR